MSLLGFETLFLLLYTAGRRRTTYKLEARILWTCFLDIAIGSVPEALLTAHYIYF